MHGQIALKTWGTRRDQENWQEIFFVGKDYITTDAIHY